MIAAGSIRPEVCLRDLGLSGFSCFQEMADNGKHSEPILGAAIKQVNVRGNFEIMLCINVEIMQLTCQFRPRLPYHSDCFSRYFFWMNFIAQSMITNTVLLSRDLKASCLALILVLCSQNMRFPFQHHILSKFGVIQKILFLFLSI